jgi:hypothetical protein
LEIGPAARELETLTRGAKMAIQAGRILSNIVYENRPDVLCGQSLSAGIFPAGESETYMAW